MRRVVRRAPTVQGLGSLARSISGSVQRSTRPAMSLTRPASVPVDAYRGRIRTPIPSGYAAVTIASDGTATAYVGPQGLGTVWYPQAAAIATSTGASDTSTCTIYVGPEGLQTQVGGQSYAGGGDTIGLAVPPLWNGYFVWAKWAGGTAGALATLTVYGEMDSLRTN